jgi:hypothetical protein
MLQPKKKSVKKKSTNPADSYPPMKDARGNATIGGGEGTTPPFTKKEMEYKKKMTGLPKGKMGKTVAKAKNGTSLGMKSVKAGYDKNPGVTRADIIVAGKGQARKGTVVKKAKAGTKVKKAFLGNILGGGVGKSLLGGAVGGFIGGGGLNKMMGAFKNKRLGSKMTPATAMENKAMKKGGSVKKCKYGCK